MKKYGDNRPPAIIKASALKRAPRQLVAELALYLVRPARDSVVFHEVKHICKRKLQLQIEAYSAELTYLVTGSPFRVATLPVSHNFHIGY